MKRVLASILYILFFSLSYAQTVLTPDKIYGELFTDVQMSRIFRDSKTFVDCVPKREPKEIVADYIKIKNNPNLRFSLKLFVEENFILPDTAATTYVSKEKDIVAHIKSLWNILERKADTSLKGSSLLPLPNSYIVPGGRFREIYYWDSYFTMLGLKESGEHNLMENMVKNFAYLISEYGHVPNGNRSYYLSRSQPPFFSLMIELLADIKGKEVYALYQPALEKEYNYWMDKTDPTKHVVKMPDGSSLNRYWDQLIIPRQESYVEDVSTAKTFHPDHQQSIFRNLRSAAESGWDFSSRWLRNGKTLQTIQTTSLIPVDLNCLLYHLEQTLSRSYSLTGDNVKASYFSKTAEQRKRSIEKYCWSVATNWYIDYNITTKKQSTSLTLAGMFPFFLNISDKIKFSKAKSVLEKKFLKYGGLTTTLVQTGQQWDAPNGWAPLQWVSIIGLDNYGDKILSRKITERWYSLNKKVFLQTGKLMEKYDVVNTSKPGGGGEYPSQDGFGWTNGVLLALINKYNLK
jgi:alpha,alpha-trehalase